MNRYLSQEELLLQSWWDRLSRYREEFVRPGLAWYEKAAAALEGKPPGAAHDANLFRTADGRVWTARFDSPNHILYREQVRSERGTPGWEFYAEGPARLTSAELAERGPVTRSSDVMGEAYTPGARQPAGGGSGGGGTPPPEAIQELRRDPSPEARAEFEEAFGLPAGGAQQYVPGQPAGARRTIMPPRR